MIPWALLVRFSTAHHHDQNKGIDTKHKVPNLSHWKVDQTFPKTLHGKNHKKFKVPWLRINCCPQFSTTVWWLMMFNALRNLLKKASNVMLIKSNQKINESEMIIHGIHNNRRHFKNSDHNIWVLIASFEIYSSTVNVTMCIVSVTKMIYVIMNKKIVIMNHDIIINNKCIVTPWWGRHLHCNSSFTSQSKSKYCQAKSESKHDSNSVEEFS